MADEDPEKVHHLTKYKTVEERRRVFDLYKEHRAAGFTRDSFTECTHQTLMKMVSDHPDEFSDDEVSGIERTYQRFWEKVGIEGAQGDDKFNAPGWIFNMKNRFKWSDRQVLVGDTENPFELTLKLVE